MGIFVKWENEEKTVIFQGFDGQWTWEEFYHINNEIIPSMIREVPHTVHVFSNFSDSALPSMTSVLKHARKMLDSTPDNMGMIVIIGANKFISLMADTFQNIFGSVMGVEIKTAENLEAAYKLIEAYEE